MKKSTGGVQSRAMIRVVILFAAVVALTGCRTYQQQNKIAAHWQRSDLAAAEKEAALIADKAADGKDTIIWRLEQGTVLHAQGKYEESNKAFDQAQEKLDQYAEEAKVKVGNEAGALLSNQANLPYRGRAYDGIMLNTYKALNYLALHDAEKARVEIIRAYQRQQDAVEENKRRIEKAEEDLEKQKDKEKIKSAEKDAKVQGKLNETYSGLDSLKVYADYVNPFTVYLDGLIFLANATGSSDLERARKSFERASSFAPENHFLKADLEAAEAATQGKAVSPTTYVVFETGCAPVRDQIRIDIPIIVTRVSYLGASFPRLQLQNTQMPSLTVLANGTNETCEALASMDSVVGHDFKNELPTIITKTIAATVAKGIAAYAVNEAANQNGGGIGGLIAQIGTAAYQMSVNIADTRTWTTLPKEFHVCRFATPADRKIELQPPGGAQKVSVTLEEGSMNLVLVKSITATGPLFVSQMKLK